MQFEIHENGPFKATEFVTSNHYANCNYEVTVINSWQRMTEAVTFSYRFVWYVKLVISF